MPLLNKGSLPHRLACVLCLCVLVPHPVMAQSLTPQENRNHFIILVDASGSVASVPAKRSALHATVVERLLPRLYRQGFGDAIPPYDPQTDFISLFHFGIVAQEPTPAYLRLKTYNFLTDFIHPVFVYRRVTPEELSESIMPATGYELTILSWAKQLAVAAAGRGGADRLSNRTILITLHDGVPNNSSSRAEESDVQRWADPDNRREAEKVIAQVNRNYRFVGDGGDVEQPPGANAGDRIFMETSEIVPVAQDELAGHAKSLDPFQELSFSWSEESGERPSGQLSAEMKPDFMNWVRSAGGKNGRLIVEAGGQPATQDWDLSPRWLLPVVVAGPLECGQRSYPLSIDIPITLRDEFLGTRTLVYNARREFETPPPSSCTNAYLAKRLAVLVFLLLLFAVATYFIYFRFFTTHIYVELPGLAIPIRIRRAGIVECGTPISPRAGLEAFTLRVPAGLLQRIFYRKADVEVEMNGGRSVSLNESGDSTLRFPTTQPSVDAFWDSVPNNPTRLTLIFKQGRQTSRVGLSYPKGIS
jgi:hypothetical protein